MRLRLGFMYSECTAFSHSLSEESVELPRCWRQANKTLSRDRRLCMQLIQSSARLAEHKINMQLWRMQPLVLRRGLWIFPPFCIHHRIPLQPEQFAFRECRFSLGVKTNEISRYLNEVLKKFALGVCVPFFNAETFFRVLCKPKKFVC